MSGWTESVLAGGMAALVWLGYNIFQDVRSIRRMMHSDRRAPNEVPSFQDDA